MLTCSTVVANNEIKPEAIFFEAHPTVFENPTTLYYNLNSISQSAEVHLLNSAGELLQTHILHSKKGKLNLNIEEPAGIYFVRLVDGKQAATIKLVKL